MSAQTAAMPGARALPTWIIGVEPQHRGSISVPIAFRDCDPMGVLWHGNYLAYAERARDDLGRHLGLSVTHFVERGWFAPIVRSQVWHHAPGRPSDLLTIEVGLFATMQPRLFHRYRFLIGDRLIAEAETEQVVTDRSFTLFLQQPPELASVLAPVV
jgi:acyl-CoA thioester hydrolase